MYHKDYRLEIDQRKVLAISIPEGRIDAVFGEESWVESLCWSELKYRQRIADVDHSPLVPLGGRQPFEGKILVESRFYPLKDVHGSRRRSRSNPDYPSLLIEVTRLAVKAQSGSAFRPVSICPRRPVSKPTTDSRDWTTWNSMRHVFGQPAIGQRRAESGFIDAVIESEEGVMRPHQARWYGF